ncbi:hypothetical protein [Kineococcus rhizosphaerae]|uniref:Uncharacterized protein n=1 Tax=Kineococcus rhizosphaerae TaxID=559628 RepID=A0A2T0R4X5_9ACTN|nr:hypothetical protein [Kineococcus rhizosphaerae]PRY15362.1 hypothetical protein CLV37_105290 [Kineococcus rhizosphaerae]
MNRRTTLTLTAVAAPALALALSASTATADTTPGPAAAPETTAVTQAVRTSPATAGVPASQYTVGHVRVADGWAAADLEPTDTDALDPATAVLQLTGGTWTVVDLGTAQVGCGTVAAPVLDALALSC